MHQKIFIATSILILSVTVQAQRFFYTSYAYTSPKELAHTLTAYAATDEQKVYALFRWITDNIDYRLKPLGLIPVFPDTSTGLKPLDELVAENVLRNKVAVCDGYARLFKTLCTYAGISCEIITGYARVGTQRTGNRFKTNHTWNAVNIDGAWKLLDVTWASGYVSYRGNYFIRQYDPKYYLTQPEYFIEDHYPEDTRWALLASMPTLQEFKYAPFKTGASVRSRVKHFFPASGVIEAEVGDTISLHVVLAEKDQRLFLSDGSGSIYPFFEVGTEDKEGEKKVNFHYVALNKKDSWLEVINEDEVLLRYKLVIKEKSQ